MLSIQELKAVSQNPSAQLLVSLLTNATGKNTLVPGFDTDGDGSLNIQLELKPVLVAMTESALRNTSTTWIKSHLGQPTNLALIGNVSASILIQQGEGDTQVPVQQAFLGIAFPDA